MKGWFDKWFNVIWPLVLGMYFVKSGLGHFGLAQNEKLFGYIDLSMGCWILFIVSGYLIYKFKDNKII